MLTLQHISDSHGKHDYLNVDLSADLIIHSGDSTNYHDVARNFHEFEAFVDWYSKVPIPIKIYVAGNHDSYLYNVRKDAEKMLRDAGIEYLNHDTLTIYDEVIYGYPTTPTFGQWYFMADRSKINKHVEMIPQSTTILINHGMPKGVMDLTENRDYSLEMVGDSALFKKTQKLENLKLFCGGHIHCLTPDYEVLTNSGWKFYNDISEDDKVLNYNTETNLLENDYINEVIVSDYQGEMYNVSNGSFLLDCTPEHKIIHYDNNDKLIYSTIESINNSLNSYTGIKIPVTFDYLKEDYDISDLELRLIVWVAADGSREKNRWRFHLKKERKINRLKKILEALNIDYTLGIRSKTGSLKISFEDKNFKYEKPLSKEVLNFSKRQCRLLVNEYLHTDGNFYDEIRYPNVLGQLSSSKKCEIDLLMELIIKAGYKFSGYIRPNCENFHCNINISKDSIKHINIRKNNISKYNYSGFVWCLNTNNGNFFVRKNGKVMLTGNSNKNIINTGLRKIGNVLYSNAAMVKDAAFEKVETYFHGNLINI